MTQTPRALVIEDKDNWQVRIGKSLRSLGFEADQARSYGQAKTQIAASIDSHQPYDLAIIDLVLGDITMSGYAGFGLVEQLLDLGTAVAIVTGYSTPALTDAVFETFGFVGFLEKQSWSEEAFRVVIERVRALHDRERNPLPADERAGCLLHLARLLQQTVNDRATTPASPPPGTVTWLHLSDLHQRRPGDMDNDVRIFNSTLVLNELLHDIEERISKDGLAPDFILFSGDVAQSGSIEEYQHAGKFFDDVLRATGLGKDRLFIVPGNHDVDRRAIYAEVANGCRVTLSSRDAVTHFLSSGYGFRAVAWSKFRGYARFVADYLDGLLPFDEELYYYVQELTVRGTNIAILGLNSTWMSGFFRDSDGNYADNGSLLVGEAQVRGALEHPQAETADLRIALMHHPLHWLQEFDMNDVEPLLHSRCEFILHGHQHRQNVASLVGPDGSTVLLASGACYDRRDRPNLYNFVQFNPTTRRGKVILRRYSDERGGFWAADTLTYRQAKAGTCTFRLN